ncbi:MAG: hypothetical protein MK132_21675 [Lentisphaerales bacterium]|nr:hypothetical protein [Lentisphaerales bacterium]
MIFLASIICLQLNASAEVKRGNYLKDQTVEGSPEAFLKKVYVDIISNKMNFEEFKTNCSSEFIQIYGKAVKRVFSKIKSVDISKRFNYKIEKENSKYRIVVGAGVVLQRK